MAEHEVRAKVAELRALQRLIQGACERRDEGWRQAVVAGRRDVGRRLGELSALLAAQPVSDASSATRNAVSVLRAALAEHQATWPAVSIDPSAPPYVASVTRVRDAYDGLDAVLAGIR